MVTISTRPALASSSTTTVARVAWTTGLSRLGCVITTPGSRWLVGVEADWQWASQKSQSAACTPPGTVAFFGPGGSGFGYCLGSDDKITSFGTARARGGVLVQDTLWYATGGLAWGHVEQTLTLNATPAFLLGTTSAAQAFSHDKVGWTVGAGVEAPLWNGWSAKAEYLYVDLGSVSDTFFPWMTTYWAIRGSRLTAALMSSEALCASPRFP